MANSSSTGTPTREKSVRDDGQDQRYDDLVANKMLEAVQKSNSKMKRMIGQLKQQLKDNMHKEVMAHQHLANLISYAENTRWRNGPAHICG